MYYSYNIDFANIHERSILMSFVTQHIARNNSNASKENVDLRSIFQFFSPRKSK